MGMTLGLGPYFKLEVILACCVRFILAWFEGLIIALFTVYIEKCVVLACLL